MAGSGQIGLPRAPLPAGHRKPLAPGPTLCVSPAACPGAPRRDPRSSRVPPEVDPGPVRIASTSPIVWDGVTMASSYPFGRWQDVQPIVGIIFDPGPAMFLSF